MKTSPPRLASWLLAQRLSGDWRDFVLGDLEEEFQARRAGSPAGARRWSWRQTIRYIVRGRSREIGIRTALGAQTADVVRLVIREGMTPTTIGIVIGAVGALASARVMQKLVFGVSPSDPLTLAAVAGTLAVVAVMASLVPAYRASRLNPLQVLRAN